MWEMLQQIAVQTASTLIVLATATLVPVVIPGIYHIVYGQAKKIRDERLRKWAVTAVLAVEQMHLNTLENPEKKKLAIDMVCRHFPKIPISVIEDTIEAAVAEMKLHKQSEITVVKNVGIDS